MRLSQKITGFLSHCTSTLYYFAVMAVKENFRNYVGRAGRSEGACSDGLVLLANGPSLGEELPRLLAGERAGCDFLAVNYFAEHEAFERLRPAYYVLSDPQFFRDSTLRDRVAALYRTLSRKVTWPMTLYVQYYNPEHFDYRAALPNGRIRIVPFHTQPYRGFRRLEFWLYRHGLGSANFGTVIQHVEYIGLLLGYRCLHLYGVDHTLTEGLTVDAQNRLCRLDRHFYDDGQPAVARPMYVNATLPPVPYTMASYMAELAELFRGHEVLRAYADRLGARIVNHTRGSMIDAYERAEASAPADSSGAEPKP